MLHLNRGILVVVAAGGLALSACAAHTQTAAAGVAGSSAAVVGEKDAGKCFERGVAVACPPK